MSRKLRMHFSDAMYHVMLRGNYRQSIFNDDTDRMQFYTLIEKAIHKFNCKVHLFCLMTNHVHLVVEVKCVPLWKIIQSISSGYASFINKRNNRSGHLFQGRYLAKIIQDEKYLLELCYYIHYNPIKAYMISDIDHYPWSSHQSYAGIERIPWLTTNYINSIFKKYDANYFKFIKKKEKYLEKIKFCEFDSDGNLIIKDSVNEKMRTTKFRDFSSLSIFEIAQTVCSYMKINIDDITSEKQNHDIVFSRSIITYFAHYHANYYLKEIAYFFKRNPDGLSRSMHHQLKFSHQDGYIQMLLMGIESDLKKILILK